MCAEQRLVRARSLPIPRLAQLVSVGCLPLLDFVNHPDYKSCASLKTLVKEVFPLKPAPEVVTCLLQRGTIDPQMRWLLASLRLWFLVLKSKPEKSDVNSMIEEANGRLGIAAVAAFRWGITIGQEALFIPSRRISVLEKWRYARRLLLQHLKEQQARTLAARRPEIFGALYPGTISPYPKST